MSQVPFGAQPDLVMDDGSVIDLSGPGWRTAVGALQVLAAGALALVLGFGASVVLTRGLGPERYGLYSVAVTVVGWAELSLSSLFYQPGIKFTAEAECWEDMAAALLQAEFVAGMAVAILLAALAAPLAGWLGSPGIANYLRLLAVGIPITALTGGHRAALIAQGAFGRATIPGLFYWPARLLLAVILLRSGLSVWAGIGALVGAAVVQLLVVRWLVRPPLLRRVSFPRRRFLSYSAPIFLNSIGIRLLTRVDLLLVQALAGAAAAGFYAAAHNLSLIPLGFVGGALSSPLLSTLSRLGKDARQAEARSLVRMALRFLICLAPLAGLVAGAAPQLVQLMYGADYMPTAPMLAWLIFGAVALTVVGVSATLLTAAGRPGWTLPLTAPLLPVAAVAHWWLIPRHGAVAAAAVTGVAAIVGAAACLAAVAHVWRIGLPLRTAGRSGLIAVAAYILGGLSPAQGLVLLIKMALVCSAIIIAFVLLGELSAAELRQVRAIASWDRLRRRAPRPARDGAGASSSDANGPQRRGPGDYGQGN